MTTLRNIAVAGLFVALLLASVPSSADEVKDNLEALERELAALRATQLELTKEATMAALSLPNFHYRSGDGLTIQASDKGWSVNFAFEAEARMLVRSKNVKLDFSVSPPLEQSRNENGTIILRRFRPQFSFCLNNCFYEINLMYNNDRFTDDSQLQRGEMQVRLDQISPWLPTVRFGIRGQIPVSHYRRGSSSVGAQSENDILSREIGLESGSYNNGMALDWRDIGLPTGRAQFHFALGQFGEDVNGLSRDSDRKDLAIYGRIEPFSRTRYAWLQGLGFENMHWWCANTFPITVPNGAPAINPSRCRRFTIRNPGHNNQETLFQLSPNGGPPSRSANHYQLLGMGWRMGPYWLRAIRGWQDFDFAENGQGFDTKGRNFLIAHDLFLWSPQGWFSGDAGTPGSIVFGVHFERTDVSCQRSNCAAGGQFSRNRIRLLEWDLWYFLPNRISVGGTLLSYDVSNLRSGRNEPQESLGCSSLGRSVRGKGCRLVNMNLSMRMAF